MKTPLQAAESRAATSSMALLTALLGWCAQCTAGACCILDESSFVQIVGARSNASSSDKLTLPSSNRSSLLELGSGIPGMKGITEQLAEAANFKMSPPEQGYHEQMVKALPVLEGGCKTRPYATEDDCKNAARLLRTMIGATEGPEPTGTWHTVVRQMLSLNFWLYTPGTAHCFGVLDRDHNAGISFEELVVSFGAQLMAAVKPVWKHLDQDRSGQVTREELHSYLRAAILVREVLPALDPVDPTIETRKVMGMARRVLTLPAAPMKRMQFYPKLLCIACIAIGTFALHCLLCTKGTRKNFAVGEKLPQDQ